MTVNTEKAGARDGTLTLAHTSYNAATHIKRALTLYTFGAIWRWWFGHDTLPYMHPAHAVSHSPSLVDGVAVMSPLAAATASESFSWRPPQ